MCTISEEHMRLLENFFEKSKHYANINGPNFSSFIDELHKYTDIKECLDYCRGNFTSSVPECQKLIDKLLIENSKLHNIISTIKNTVNLIKFSELLSKAIDKAKTKTKGGYKKPKKNRRVYKNVKTHKKVRKSKRIRTHKKVRKSKRIRTYNRNKYTKHYKNIKNHGGSIRRGLSKLRTPMKVFAKASVPSAASGIAAGIKANSIVQASAHGVETSVNGVSQGIVWPDPVSAKEAVEIWIGKMKGVGGIKGYLFHPILNFLNKLIVGPLVSLHVSVPVAWGIAAFISCLFVCITFYLLGKLAWKIKNSKYLYLKNPDNFIKYRDSTNKKQYALIIEEGKGELSGEFTVLNCDAYGFVLDRDNINYLGINEDDGVLMPIDSEDLKVRGRDPEFRIDGTIEVWAREIHPISVYEVYKSSYNISNFVRTINKAKRGFNCKNIILPESNSEWLGKDASYIYSIDIAFGKEKTYIAFGKEKTYVDDMYGFYVSQGAIVRNTSEKIVFAYSGSYTNPYSMEASPRYYGIYRDFEVGDYVRIRNLKYDTMVCELKQNDENYGYVRNVYNDPGYDKFGTCEICFTVSKDERIYRDCAGLRRNRKGKIGKINSTNVAERYVRDGEEDYVYDSKQVQMCDLELIEKTEKPDLEVFDLDDDEDDSDAMRGYRMRP